MFQLIETVALDDASEEEPEELFPDTGKSAPTANRESKKEREDKLRQMMEDDDGMPGLNAMTEVAAR